MDMIAMCIICISNILCFIIGAVVGQKVVRNERIIESPIKKIKEHKSKKKAEEETNKIDTILQNIEKYDGTGRNQKDVPN